MISIPQKYGSIVRFEFCRDCFFLQQLPILTPDMCSGEAMVATFSFVAFVKVVTWPIITGISLSWVW